MKSVKEKAKKWCSEHSNKNCTEQCDGCWQLNQVWGCEQHNMETAYEAGANYVLEAIEDVLSHPRRFVSDDIYICEAMIVEITKRVEQLKDTNK